MQKNIIELILSAKQQRFGQKKYERITSECRICEYLFLCHGECPRNRFTVSASGECGHNYLCEGLKMFFKHSEPLMRLMRNELMNGRPADNVVG